MSKGCRTEQYVPLHHHETIDSRLRRCRFKEESSIFREQKRLNAEDVPLHVYRRIGC